ncbi:MAG: hypothetical protein LBT12_02535 [Oscillospiraceae bacterium]|nr:hypothetical protein [Oscillospiraceae bacterium]
MKTLKWVSLAAAVCAVILIAVLSAGVRGGGLPPENTADATPANEGSPPAPPIAAAASVSAPETPPPPEDAPEEEALFAELPGDTRQLVVVESVGGAVTARFFEMDGGGRWVEDETLRASGWAGANGVAVKTREGDEITPVGQYAVGDAFYTSDKPDTGLNTFKITENTYWIDDPNSQYYNMRIEGTDGKDWDSAERMMSYAENYKYGFVIGFNTERTPGAGSAIFFHVGSRDTTGCVAVSESDCLKYLKALDAAKNPRIRILGDGYMPPETPGLPEGFTYVRDVNPGIRADLRYAGADNFTGAPADGYLSAQAAILTTRAATALSAAQTALERDGLGLLIYDAYRPQKASDYFLAWSRTDDERMRAQYFPDLMKSELHELGYIARRSGHSRGSTVDLTLVSLDTGVPLDMGGGFDLFDGRSWHGSEKITAVQSENREKLKAVMEKYGFTAYDREWWHYTYGGEPFPDTYFDFDVK